MTVRSKQPVLFGRGEDSADPALYRFLADAQGGRFFQTGSALWFETRRFVFDSAPAHRLVVLDRGEANHLFRSGAAIIRYTCGSAEGSPSFEFICDDRDYGFHSLAADARRRVRRGLDSCAVKPIGMDLLASSGAAINRSVLERQGRGKGSFLVEDAQWKKYLNLCGTFSNVEAFGAFVEGRLCAFALAALLDDYCYLYHTHGHSDYLKQSPMNALVFTITREMLKRPEVVCVSQGVEPFLARPELEHFKLAMGYRKRPIRRQMLVNPVLQPFLSRPVRWAAERMLRGSRPQWLEGFSRIVNAVDPPACSLETEAVRHN